MPDDAEYDPVALRILDGMERPPRRPDAHIEGANPSGLTTFDPMAHPAYAATVRATSDRRRDAAGRPRMDGARLVAQVILAEDGRLFVEAPGSPPTRIVAIPEKRAAAVGQRVAELVEEALAARARDGEGKA